MTRNEMQKKVVSDFLKLDPLKGIALISTGAGKARIAVMVMREMYNRGIKHFLYLAESLTNVGISFPDEVKKWDEELLPYIEVMTYQSAYKIDKNLDDYFIVADEIDFALTEKYGQFFWKYKDVPTLGLTGTLTKEKRKLFHTILPVFSEISSEDLQEKAILNRIVIKPVLFMLSKEKNIEIKYDKGSFKQSENGQYQYYAGWQEETEKKLELSFDENEIRKLKGILYKTIPRKQTEILYNLNSSADLAKKLANELLEKDSKNKILVFSKRIKQAEKVNKNVYHGKSDEKVFFDFQQGKTRLLTTVQKLNRGVNIPNLNIAIIESYDSSITKLKQAVGRLFRLPPDETATVYILVPYFLNKKGKRQHTRAVKWINKLLAEYKPKKEDFEIIDLRI